MTSEYVTMYYGFSRWGKEKAKVVQNFFNLSDCRHLGSTCFREPSRYL